MDGSEVIKLITFCISSFFIFISILNINRLSDKSKNGYNKFIYLDKKQRSEFEEDCKNNTDKYITIFDGNTSITFKNEKNLRENYINFEKIRIESFYKKNPNRIPNEIGFLINNELNKSYDLKKKINNRKKRIKLTKKSKKEDRLILNNKLYNDKLIREKDEQEKKELEDRKKNTKYCSAICGKSFRVYKDSLLEITPLNSFMFISDLEDRCPYNFRLCKVDHSRCITECLGITK